MRQPNREEGQKDTSGKEDTMTVMSREQAVAKL